MTADAFARWLAAMRAAGLARSDAACARLLGVTKETVRVWKLRGAGTATALACAALLHRLEPYG